MINHTTDHVSYYKKSGSLTAATFSFYSFRFLIQIHSESKLETGLDTGEIKGIYNILQITGNRDTGRCDNEDVITDLL